MKVVNKRSYPKFGPSVWTVRNGDEVGALRVVKSPAEYHAFTAAMADGDIDVVRRCVDGAVIATVQRVGKAYRTTVIVAGVYGVR